MNALRTIVHVSTTKTWYGGENQCFLLADGLRRQGHRCIMFARSDGEPLQRFREAGLEVQPIGAANWNPWELWRIHRAIRNLQPDIVHTHDSHALVAGGLGAMNLNCLRITTRRCMYPLNVVEKYRWGCDRLIALSETVAQACRESGFPSHRIHLVPSGVAPERIEGGDRERGRRSLGIAAHERIALQVGSLVDAKGHIDVLEALVLLRNELPEWRFFFAGDGGLEQPLRDFVRQHQLEHRVTFLGYRRDVPDLLKAADLVLMPSRAESLGTSAIDALLAERPLITSTTGGLPDLVGPRPGEAAVAELVPAANPRMLADAIRRSVLTLPDANRRARLGRQRALREYTAARMVAGNLEVYEQSLQARQRVRRVA